MKQISMKQILSIVSFVLILITNHLCLYSAEETFNAIYFGTGAGYNIQAEHSEFSLMIGYDKYFEGTPLFTLGFLTEIIFTEHTELLVGIPIGFYPIEQIKLWLAPCYAFNINYKDHSVDNYEHKSELPFDPEFVEHIKFENQFMLKFGAGYLYNFNNINLGILSFIEGTLIAKELVIGFGIKLNFYF